jgi:hypothetical protein
MLNVCHAPIWVACLFSMTLLLGHPVVWYSGHQGAPVTRLFRLSGRYVVGPGRYCSYAPRHVMPFDSIEQGS